VTGRYIYDKTTKKLVKVSNVVRGLSVDAYVPRDGYHDENLGSWNEKRQKYESYHVTSKKDKQRRMKELGLTERGGRDVQPHGKTNYHDMTAERATVFVGRP